MMKSRLAGVAALTAITGALVAGPAGAQEQPNLVYRASGAASALHISVAGESVTLGEAQSLVDSTVKASAVGAGLITQLASKATAEVVDNGDESAGPVCSPLTLPAEVPVLDLATGCGAASVSIVDGLPTAAASGQIAGLGVGVTDLVNLPVLGDVLGQTTEQAQQALTDLLDTITAQTGVELPVDLESTIDDLLEAITSGGNALSVEVGPATTESSNDGTIVSAAATGATSVIKILNRDLLNLDPVLTIQVLPATAAVERLADGTFSQEGATSVLKLDIADDIAGLLGLPAEEIEVASDDDLQALRDSGLFDDNDCLNPGGVLVAPLNGLVCLRLAAVDKYNENGVVGVRSTALELRLLDSLMQAAGQSGGVTLAFSDAIAEVTATQPDEPRSLPPVTPEAPEKQRSLPRTGGEIPLAATIGLAGVAIAGLTLVRRSRAIAG